MSSRVTDAKGSSLPRARRRRVEAMDAATLQNQAEKSKVRAELAELEARIDSERERLHALEHRIDMARAESACARTSPQRASVEALRSSQAFDERQRTRIRVLLQKKKASEDGIRDLEAARDQRRDALNLSLAHEKVIATHRDRLLQEAQRKHAALEGERALEHYLSKPPRKR